MKSNRPKRLKSAAAVFVAAVCLVGGVAGSANAQQPNYHKQLENLINFTGWARHCPVLTPMQMAALEAKIGEYEQGLSLRNTNEKEKKYLVEKAKVSRTGWEQPCDNPNYLNASLTMQREAQALIDAVAASYVNLMVINGRAENCPEFASEQFADYASSHKVWLGSEPAGESWLAGIAPLTKSARLALATACKTTASRSGIRSLYEAHVAALEQDAGSSDTADSALLNTCWPSAPHAAEYRWTGESLDLAGEGVNDCAYRNGSFGDQLGQQWLTSTLLAAQMGKIENMEWVPNIYNAAVLGFNSNKQLTLALRLESRGSNKDKIRAAFFDANGEKKQLALDNGVRAYPATSLRDGKIERTWYVFTFPAGSESKLTDEVRILFELGGGEKLGWSIEGVTKNQWEYPLELATSKSNIEAFLASHGRNPQ